MQIYYYIQKIIYNLKNHIHTQIYILKQTSIYIEMYATKIIRLMSWGYEN